jgi:threonine aldolase
MDWIDLRSDTVSWPTLEMRLAMANAVVGDDIFGDDPTVKKLELDSATLIGKESALFVSSGTLANLLSIFCHCELGDEIILGDCSHMFLYETAGMSALSGVMPHCLKVQDDGTLRLEDIIQAIRPKDDHQPITRLIVLENTHNAKGGVPLTASYTNSVGKLAKSKGLKLHIDGARIFNASTALNVDVKTLVEAADSITFCLSKGLCAPFGSVLCGTKEFIEKARHRRKMLGGGLRQSGIMASAGLIALHKMTKRLPEDHANAFKFYEGLQDITGIKRLSCHTNFVWFELTAPISPQVFVDELVKYKIKLTPKGTKFRCAFHYWIMSDKVESSIRAFKAILSSYSSKL